MDEGVSDGYLVGLTLAVVVLAVVTLKGRTAMAWTAAHQTLLETYADTFGLPALDGESARTWTRELAEQFKFSFPKEGWGTKQADPGRPPSTDCICTQKPFTGYDVIISQGSPSQALAHNPEPINLTGQIYIPVEATDHLTESAPAQDYPYPDEPTTGAAYQARVQATYVEAGRSFPDPADMDAFRHFMRYGYSTRYMPEPEAADKHIAELRADLGLPAAP
jgi:hypothetical protein